MKRVTGIHRRAKTYTSVSCIHRISRRWLLLVSFVVVVAAPTGVHAQLLRILEQPVGTLLSLGEELVLSVVAESDQPVRYQWRLNGVNVPGANESILSLSGVQVEHAGRYTVMVKSDDHAVVSEPAFVRLDLPFVEPADAFVNRRLLTILNASVRTDNSEASVEPGEPAHGGKPGGKSVWFRWLPLLGGIATVSTRGSDFDTVVAVYSGDDLVNLSDGLLGSDDDGGGYLSGTVRFNAELGREYQIVVDGYDGAAGEIVLSLHLEVALDRLPQFTLLPRDRTVRSGDATRLELDFQGPFGTTIQWHGDGVPLPGAVSRVLDIPAVEMKHVANYHAVLRTPLGRQISTAPVSLQINETTGRVLPEDAGARGKLTDARMSGNLAAEVTQQRASLQSLPRAKLLSSGPSRGYTGTQIFSTYNSTTEPDEPLHCGEVGGASEWFAYQPETNGWLHLNTDGSDFDTVLAVYTNDGPVVAFAHLRSVACGNVSSPHGGDRVRVPVSSGIVYYIAVDGVDAATGTAVLNYNLGDPPSLDAPPSDQIVAAGTEVTLSSSANGSAPLLFEWRFNGEPLVAATNASLTLTNVGPAQIGQYQVVVSNPVDVAISGPALLLVQAPPSIVGQPAGRTVSLESPVTLSVEATGLPDPGFQWQLNGENIAGATNAHWSIEAFTAGDEGHYRVVVSNAAGTILSDVARLALDRPLRIEEPRLRTDGGFEFRMIGPAEAELVIDISSNLTDWTPFSTNFTGNGWVEFLDSEAGTASLRFYRFSLSP